MDVAGNTKFVELVAGDNVFEAGGGRAGLFGYSTTQGTLRFQYGASPTANVAFTAIRNGANTFTGLQTFNAGVTVAGGASRFSGLAGTGVRMATFAADGTLSVATDATTARSLIGALAESEKGSANGVAPLGSDSKIAATYLPSYVDDVIEFAGLASFPATGEAGKIYVTKDTNRTYRWSGSAYVEISASLALGETSSTAYRGDRGKTAYDHSQITAANPHGTTFAQLASKPTTLSGYGIMDAQPLDSDLTAIAALSTQAFGRSLLTQADAAGSRALIGAEEARQISSVGEFFSGTPYTLSIGTKKKIELWLYSSYGGTGGVITIAPSGGGSVSLNFTGWYARMTIVFDRYNNLIVDSQLGVTHVASGGSTSITFSSTNPSGQGWKITRCELSD